MIASARRLANGRPDLAERIGEGFAPLRLRREAGVGAGEAAQQALRGRTGQRIGRRRGAQAAGVGDRRDRIEHRLVTRQVHEIGLVAELAAEHGIVEHVGVVDHRIDDRHLALVARIAQPVHRTRIKEAAVADAGQIELRQRFRRQQQERAERVAVLIEPVVREEIIVGHQDAVPAPDPFVVQCELTLGVDGAAEVAVAGLPGKRSGIELVDAVRADLVGAVEQALSEFALQQHALPRQEARGEGCVHVGRDRPIIGNLDAIARIVRAGNITGYQEAALPLHGRVGRREIGHVGERHAEEFELCGLEIQHLLLLVVDDARTLDLPQWRLLRIVLARRAGRVDAVLEHRVVAAGAVGAARGHAGLVGRVHAQRIDETVAVIVGEIQDLGIGDLAVGIRHADVAFGMKPLGLLVVDDPVGLDAGAVVEQLDVTDRGDARIVVVVVDLGRLNQHLVVVGDPRRLRTRRQRIVGEALGVGRRHGGSADQPAERGGSGDSEQEPANGPAAPVRTHQRAPRQTRHEPSVDGSHYPSS
ncbi:hypothetical protein ACVMBZ_009216 [Bradyrhizobium liaoningense]